MQCPFHNTILDCHVLSVQSAIIPPVTFGNYYFFDCLIFSVKQEKNENKAEEEWLANCADYS